MQPPQKNISKLHIANDLPPSHSWIQTRVGTETIPGILWDREHILDSSNRLLLYQAWATVHFATPWYEIQSSYTVNDKDTQRDLELLHFLLGKNLTPPKTIIDVHCGSGRHSIALTKQGFQVVGMEEIALPLKQAQEKGKKEKSTARFIAADPTAYQTYTNTADIVISMFNSLGYTFSYPDDKKQLTMMINLLKPGGYFVLDIRNHEFQKKRYAHPVTYVDNIALNHSPQTTATIYTTKYWQDNRLGAEEKIIVHDAGSSYVAQHTTYGWNTYTVTDLTAMLHDAGAELVEIHEDYYSSPENLGERIFLVAQKLPVSSL